MKFSGKKTASARFVMAFLVAASVAQAGPTRTREVKTHETLIEVKKALEAQRAQRGNSPSVEPVLKEVSDHITKRNELETQIKGLREGSPERKEAEAKRESLDKELAEIGRRRGHEISTRLSGNKILTDLAGKDATVDASLKGFAAEVVKSNSYSAEANAGKRAEIENKAAESAAKVLGVSKGEVSSLFSVNDPVAKAQYLDAVKPLVDAAEGHSQGGKLALKPEEIAAVQSTLKYERELAESEGRPVAAQSLRSVSDIVAMTESGSITERFEALRGKERQVMAESMGRSEGIVEGLSHVLTAEQKAQMEKLPNGKQLVADREALVAAAKDSVGPLKEINAEYRKTYEELMKEEPNSAKAKALREKLRQLADKRSEAIKALVLVLKSKGVKENTIADFMKEFSEEGRMEMAARLLFEMRERMKAEDPKITDKEVFETARTLACDCAGGKGSIFCKVANAFPKMVAAGIGVTLFAGSGSNASAATPACAGSNFGSQAPVSTANSMCVSHFVKENEATARKSGGTSGNGNGEEVHR